MGVTKKRGLEDRYCSRCRRKILGLPVESLLLRENDEMTFKFLQVCKDVQCRYNLFIFYNMLSCFHFVLHYLLVSEIQLS